MKLKTVAKYAQIA